MGWTALNALLPGAGLLAAGRRRLGAVVLGGFAALLALMAWVAGGGTQTAARWAVDRTTLVWLILAIAGVALVWAAVIVAGWLLLRPRRLSRGRQVAGGLLVAALVAAVVVPAVFVGRLAGVQRDFIAGVFEDGESATVQDVPDPFGSKERVNVLLLGSDAGPGREGTRTDTVIVASTDTDTGDTTLISLPRNLQNLPFPEDSPLAEVYPAPKGFWTGSESESLLNAVYRNGPDAYPDLLGPTDNPGADFLKLGVGEALGLEIDYYLLVDLDGFHRLVDALGGITVNVNYWVPIGGNPGTGELPDDYLRPGPDQELDGARALDFARGRFGLTDYDRMARQRCTIKAIIEAADPVTLLRRYEALAETTEDIVLTDIPSSALDDFVDLAFLVKDAAVRSLVLDTSVIDPAYPDYDRIRALVERALDPPTPVAGDAPVSGSPAPAPSATPTDPAEPPAPEPTEQAVEDVEDVCAYDPQLAAEQLAEGEPPTKD